MRGTGSRPAHCDALRLDAVHAIYDFGARHILAELAETAADCDRRLGRPFHLIAESDLNDPRLVRPPAVGGADAAWGGDGSSLLMQLADGALSNLLALPSYAVVVYAAGVPAWMTNTRIVP